MRVQRIHTNNYALPSQERSGIQKVCSAISTHVRSNFNYKSDYIIMILKAVHVQHMIVQLSINQIFYSRPIQFIDN